MAASPPTRAGASRHTRAIAGAVSLGCLGVLGLAAWLTPSAAGHGTHTQIGMPPCGWAMTLDQPCPTCGMTTAFAHAADGAIGQAALAQPAGLLMAVLAAGVFWGAGEVAVFGSNLSPIGAKLLRTRWILLGAAVLGGAWIFKIATWTE